MTCELCGAAIGDETKHKAWHEEERDFEHRLSMVEDQASSTANVLYQRGID